jgi:hypothetical protein
LPHPSTGWKGVDRTQDRDRISYANKAEIAEFDFILGELPESIIQGGLFIAEVEGRNDEMEK